MTIHAQGRATSVQEQAVKLLNRVGVVKSKVSAPGVHHRLKYVENTVGDVERYFLADLERTARTREEESRWLDYALQVLLIAEFALSKVESDLAERGVGLTYLF